MVGEVMEQRRDDALRLRVLAPRRVAEIHLIEHERAQRRHGGAHLRALDDVARQVGALDEVVHERVDAARAGRPEDVDRPRRQLLGRQNAGA
jgi:hypothetical protein